MGLLCRMLLPIYGVGSFRMCRILIIIIKDIKFSVLGGVVLGRVGSYTSPLRAIAESS